MTSRLALAAAAAAFIVAGCETTTQLTSGAAYLKDYPDSASFAASDATRDVDAQVRDIAAVEPDLEFPARIGLARIENGRLTATPADELEIWADLAERLGPEVGEFAPVSPLIAAMVDPGSEEPRRYYGNGAAAEAVADIRRGAARQHLDYVLAYEVTSDWSNQANALSVADVSILGLFIVPSRSVEVEAAASALLLDVRNGYPYGTASAIAERTRVARAAYSGGARESMVPLASREAVANLADEVETMVADLRAQLAQEK
jgi:hypothetical protein